jgi:cupin fold WbuC family metalloprotein
MKIVAQSDLDQLIADAQSSPRKRKHFNIHTDLNDPIQRLFVAFEPGTYVQPHRHTETGKWEMFILLQGEAAILLFEDNGRVRERITLSDQHANRLIEIPLQCWHTLVSLQPGTLLFEGKPGPYKPLDDKDFANWAPKENTAHTGEFVRWFEHAQAGESAPILNA